MGEALELDAAECAAVAKGESEAELRQVLSSLSYIAMVPAEQQPEEDAEVDALLHMFG